MGNRNLTNARRAKKDEFYTQYETIEDELIYYKKHFEGKTVYCNCDDPRWSNFFKYFVDNFHELKLKRLIASCYVDQSYNLFTINEKREPAVWADYNGWLVDGRVPDVSEIKVKELKGDGDFRSEECIELLKQADIVVTNPPFSLFREFVPMLIEHNKKFLILGNQNAIAYKDIFPLLKSNVVSLGVSIRSGDVEFEVPDEYVEGVEKFRECEEGRKYVKVTGVRWYTNINKNVDVHLKLTKTYKDNEHKYPEYDNYRAININKTSDIPKDYKCAMGVPITFMDKYNPEQFEILGITKSWDNNKYKSYPGIEAPIINGKALYTRILIRNKRLTPDIYGGEQS